LTSNDEVPPSSKEMAATPTVATAAPTRTRRGVARVPGRRPRRSHRTSLQPDRRRDAEDRCHRAGDDREDLPEERSQDTVDLRATAADQGEDPKPSTANAAIRASASQSASR
jgi:hypothetical protein